MALIVSAASGNFNAGATWVGGVVPGVGDEAQAATGHTITITADATCDEVSNTGTGTFVLNNGVTLTANVTNKSTANLLYTARFNAAAPAQAWIVGNCTGNAGNNTAAAGNASTGTLNITGDCIGGSLNINASGAINGATGVLNITGNCIGGAGGFGANNSSAGVLNITGNCTGGATSTTFGANNAAAGTMLVVGTIQASEFTGGVGGGNRQQTTLLTGPFLISPIYGVSPISSLTWRWAIALNNQTYMEVPTNDLLDKRNLVTPDNATNFPDASDVRSGVAYGIGGVVFGTCAVPDPSAVALGVPVSDTVGTLASQTAEQIATAVWGAATRTITGGVVDTLTNAPASVTASDIWTYSDRQLTTASGPTAAEIRQEMDSNSNKLANLDATISSRLSSASYTAPANSDIAAIKSKTDNLPASPAAVSDIPTTAQISAAVEGSLLDENDGQAVLNAIVGAIGNTNVDEISLVAAIRSDLERAGGKLDSVPTAAANATAVWAASTKEITGGTITNLTNAPDSVTPADIWTYGTRTITGGTVDTLTNAPSVPSASAIADEVRLELAPELSNLDAPVSGATAPSASTVATAVRSELSVELARVDAAISSRLADADYVAPANSDVAAVKAVTDALNTERLANVATTAIVGNLIAQANS
jgi:hypothetical protein